MTKHTRLPPPTVSVVMPVRNGGAFIPDAVQSVLSQDFRDIELLIVDDGSTDFDYDQFATQDVRVRVIHLPPVGVSRARNTGIGEARGRFVAFLDSDDVWFPGKLTAQVRYLEKHSGVGVVFGEMKRWYADADGQFLPAHDLTLDVSALCACDPSRSGWVYTSLLMGLLIGMTTPLVRRSVFSSVGLLSEEMSIGEDYEFWLRASRTTEMHCLAGQIALYRFHGQSTMLRIPAENHLARLLLAAREKWGLADPENSKLVSEREFDRRIGQTEFDHGYRHYWKGNRAVARGAFANAFLRGARPVRSLVYYLLCVIHV